VGLGVEPSRYLKKLLRLPTLSVNPLNRVPFEPDDTNIETSRVSLSIPVQG